MKKILLSAFVILTFTAYTIHSRVSGVEPVSVVAPTATTNSQNDPAPQTSTGTVSTPQPTSAQARQVQPGYKSGTYTGDVTDAYYGNVQVQVTIGGGKITDVRFLDYPQDRRTSIVINTQAMPFLKSEAIQAQSANVDIVSGATQTSLAFRQSLQSALSQAK